MHYKDTELQSQLEGITSLTDAESAALELVRRLNAVAKHPEADETDIRRIYTLKRRFIHYCDARGYVAEKTKEADGLQAVTIEAHGRIIGLHRKSVSKIGAEKRLNTMIKEIDELPPQIELWRVDAKNMLEALHTILLYVNTQKPEI